MEKLKKNLYLYETNLYLYETNCTYMKKIVKVVKETMQPPLRFLIRI